MGLDPITKWLVRISASIIISLGMIVSFAIPLIALKVGSIISLTQETIQSNLKVILTELLTSL